MVQVYRPEPIEPIKNSDSIPDLVKYSKSIREDIGRAVDHAHRLQNIWIGARQRSIDEDFIQMCKEQENLLRQLIIDLDRHYDRIKS